MAQEQNNQSSQQTSTSNIVSYHTLNKQGRDFVVGDIHGMFNALDDLLKEIEFDTAIDRLFSVGDLVDRGTESDRVLEYLSYDWFYSIKGNHEIMLLESAYDASTYDNWVDYNGGDWWPKIKADKQIAIREAIKDLPLVFDIETKRGKIGVVHADIRSRTNWDEFVKEVESNKKLQHYILWSRQRYNQYRATGSTDQVQGVKRVIVGHTPIKDTMQIGNVYYIDTGAAYTNNNDLAMLTVMQIHPDIEYFQVKTKRKKKLWFF